MSQFPQSAPPTTLSMPRFSISGASGPAVPVQVQALEDPSMATDQSAAQLSGALRAFSATVGNLGDRQKQSEYEQQVAADKAERNAEKARIALDNAVKNTAAMDGREWIPKLINDINTGAVRPTEADGGDPETFVDRLIRDRSVGLGDVYENELRRVVAPRAINGVYVKMEADKKAAIKTQRIGFENRILATENPEQLDSVIQDARKQPGMDEHVNDVLAKTLPTFAKANNATMVDAIKSSLGGDQIQMQDYADRLLEAASARADTERNRQFANEAAQIREDALNNQDTPQEVKDRITEAANRLGIEPRVVEQQVSTMNTEIKRAQEENMRRMAYERANSEVMTANTHLVAQVLGEAGDATGVGQMAGFGTRPDFSLIPGLPSEIGGTEAQKNNFIVEARRQSQVNLDNLDSSNFDNVNRWTRYFRGLANIGMEDPAIKDRLLSLDFNATDKAKDQVASQKNALAAQTYMMIRGINPNYAEKLVASDPRAKKFYDNVAIQTSVPGAVLTDQMIRAATQRASVDPSMVAQPSDKEWKAIVAKAPNLTPSLMQYAVRTYKDQEGQAGALDYAIEQAQNRSVQLWQPWAGSFANKYTPIAWFTADNNSAARPLVELGTLADAGPESRPAVASAMETVLKQRAAEINKNDPTLKLDPQDLNLNYIGGGTWAIDGIEAGRFHEQNAGKYFVTDAQVREQMRKDAGSNATTLLQLETELANLNKKALAENGGKPIDEQAAAFDFVKAGLLSKIKATENQIKVKKFMENKK